LSFKNERKSEVVGKFSKFRMILSSLNRIKLLIGAFFIIVMTLTSCSSGGSVNVNSNTTVKNSNTSTSSGSSSNSGNSGSSSNSDVFKNPLLKSSNPVVNQFYSYLQYQSKAVYKATYNDTSNNSGSATQLVLEQNPPNFLASEGSGGTVSLLFIDNKKFSYNCASGDSTTPMTCTKSPASSGGGSAQALVNLFSGGYLVGTMVEYIQLDRIAVTGSVKTVGGIKSDCITFDGSGTMETYCDQSKGIITEIIVGNSSQYVLTSLSMSAPLSDFNPPQGATMMTVGNS
jgi:hypothetical protein